MANGLIISGIQITGNVQTANKDIEICTWTMPENTTARVEVYCIVQKVNDISVKNSFMLAATVRKTGIAVASIISGPTKYQEEGVASLDITISTDGNDIVVLTSTFDVYIHRLSAFMDIYSIEQSISFEE